MSIIDIFEKLVQTSNKNLHSTMGTIMHASDTRCVPGCAVAPSMVATQNKVQASRGPGQEPEHALYRGHSLEGSVPPGGLALTNTPI
jgi:hypothetical protein